MIASAVTIAGSDSSGGAGIQADLKTMTALGVYGQSAITALTAQNTCGVQGVLPIDPDFVQEQIASIFEDIVPDAVKIGMLPNAAVVHAVAESLRRFGARNVVLDPVMVATSGAALSEDAAVTAMVEELLPSCVLATPNIPEAQVLSGQTISDRAGMEAAARAICERGCAAVLVKGGHAVEDASDVLCVAGEAGCEPGLTWFEGRRVDTDNTHGTGCTLSSAIAAHLAQGLSLNEAVRRAKEYLTGALRCDLHLGRGHGPVNHMWLQAEGKRR